MRRSRFFTAIIGAIVFQGSLSPIRGQVPSPAASVPAAAPAVPRKLPLTYVSTQTPADQLQLNADNSFSLQEAGQAYHGTFSISGSTLELRISETNSNTTATIQGASLTDSGGQMWVLREQPAHPAPVADIVRNQDVISLVKAGLDDEIVIAKIGSSKCQFDTSPEALTQLRQRGVSAAVIKAMVGSLTLATGEGAASTVPAPTPGVPANAGLPDAALNPPAAPSIQPAEPRQDQLNKTTSDLKGVTGDLGVQSRPIATNGNELAALKIRGERNYTDIKLGKTKKPVKFADITLLLKNVDPKKNKYTVEVMADDKLTEKKDKNINEPVQFYTAKGGHIPYELVINAVNKNEIVGYLSTPRTTTDWTPAERIYQEVHLGPTKQPQRFGDIALMLRETDPEKQVYSVDVMADDKLTLMQNKNVNDVVRFYTIKGGRSPYNLLINQVTKDGIVGYLWHQPNNVEDVPIENKLQLLSPANGANVTTTTPTLQWAAFPDADRYDVSVRNDGTSQQVFLHSTQGTQITVLPALQDGQKYEWTVQAYNSSGQRIAWSYSTITTSSTPSLDLRQPGVTSEGQQAGLPSSSVGGPIGGQTRAGAFHLVEEGRSSEASWAVIYDLSGTYSVRPGEVLVTIKTGAARKARSLTTDPVLSSLRVGVCYQISADGRFDTFPQVADARQEVPLNDVTLKDGEVFKFTPGTFRIPLPTPTPERNWLCSLLSEPNGHYYPAHDTGRRTLIPPASAATQIRVRNDSDARSDPAAIAAVKDAAATLPEGSRVPPQPRSAYISSNPPAYKSADPNIRIPPNTTILDNFDGSSAGRASGVHYVKIPGAQPNKRGASFSRKLDSRIEYPQGIPSEGTLEWWINVASGYFYQDFQLHANQDQAEIFSTDVHGGDVTWPGTANVLVSANGDVSFFTATNKFNRPPVRPIEPRGTPFRFNSWHAIGVSYGSQGEFIMVDGKVMASALTRTQTLGAAGNHAEPLDVPTIGQTVSHFWASHRYDGGFEGTVALFRASSAQQDWYLARGVAADFRPPDFGSANRPVAQATPSEVPVPPDAGSAGQGTPVSLRAGPEAGPANSPRGASLGPGHFDDALIISPPASGGAVSLKLPATYTNAQAPADELRLNADNTFALQEGGQTYRGTFVATGGTLKLNISGVPETTTATIQGSNITDSSGQTWVAREQTAPATAAANILQNQDVIKMAKAGLDDALIIAKISSSKCQFDTSTDALIQLKQSGVSAAVLQAVVSAK